MGFAMYRNSTQLAEFVVLIVFTPLGIAVTSLRFIATGRSARKASLEDWMAVVATIFFVLFNIASGMAVGILNGRSIEQEIFESPSDYKRMRKWDMAGLYFYFGFSLSAKLSVLALYYRIFGVQRLYRIWIYILGGIQTVLIGVFCVFQALQCRPFDRYFDRSIPGTCKEENTVVLGGELPNSAVDFAMVILVMFMIKPRHLAPATKWKLRFLFGVGLLVGLLGIVKVIITYSSAELYAFSMIALWTCVQSFAALFCCSVPVFHPLITVAPFWNKLASRIYTYASFGRASRSRTTKHSSTSGGLDSTGKGQPPWKQLDEGHNTKQLAWPKATHQNETHVLSNFPTQGSPPVSSGIRVQRNYDVV